MKSALIVEDHAIFRNGLVEILKSDNWEVTPCEGYVEFLDALGTKPFGLALIDLQLSNGKTGFDVCNILKKENPDTKILILSQYDDEQFVELAKKVSIDGYLSKWSDASEVLEAIEHILSGRSYYSHQLQRRTESRQSFESRNKTRPVSLLLNTLTKKEREVMQCIGELDDTSDGFIATHLKSAPATVREHKRSIFRKLGVKEISAVVKFYFRYLRNNPE